MFESIKDILLELLRAPKGTPSPPTGAYQHTQIFRASPQFLQYRLLWFFVTMVALVFVLGIVSLVMMSRIGVLGVFAAILLFLLWAFCFILVYFLVRLEYEMRYYIVTERSLRIRKGVWNILEQTLTFVNIQNIKVEQGPIERMFGIANLVVETAGGGSSSSSQEGGTGRNYHRAVMQGLDNAGAVRDLIMGYLKSIHRQSGLGDPEEASGRNRLVPRKTDFSERETEALGEILAGVKQLREVLIHTGGPSSNRIDPS